MNHAICELLHLAPLMSMFSRFVYTVAWGTTSFLSLGQRVARLRSVHPVISGWTRGCCHLLALEHLCAFVSTPVFIAIGYVPGSGLAGPQDSSLLSSWGTASWGSLPFTSPPDNTQVPSPLPCSLEKKPLSESPDLVPMSPFSSSLLL